MHCRTQSKTNFWNALHCTWREWGGWSSTTELFDTCSFDYWTVQGTTSIVMFLFSNQSTLCVINLSMWILFWRFSFLKFEISSDSQLLNFWYWVPPWFRSVSFLSHLEYFSLYVAVLYGTPSPSMTSSRRGLDYALVVVEVRFIIWADGCEGSRIYFKDKEIV